MNDMVRVYPALTSPGLLTNKCQDDARNRATNWVTITTNTRGRPRIMPN